jgi:tripartite-type tricarboxylate transporter receptor subunit TctC
MPHSSRAGFFACVVVVASTLLAVPGAAEEVADFYKDKTIAILMGTGPGGSYDLYGRTIAEHLGRHIPGHPTIIVEHMPGAGGVIAGNHVYSVAPQDGTRILLSHALPLVEKLQSSDKVRFETHRFQWLGAYDAIAQAMTLWHAVPAKTVAELKVAPLVIGSFNNTHLTYQWAMLLKTVLDANYKVITGYRSGNDLNLAMERGEIDGWTASWENLAGTRPQWLAEKKVNLLVQFTLERQAELPDVPTLIELAPPDNKDVAEFLTSGTPIARAMAVGPQVPADRVGALRTAFDALMSDPQFLADAKKRRLEIHPRNAAKTQALVDTIVSASPELVARVKKAIGDQGTSSR